MQISAKVEIDDFDLQIKNERDVVDSMAKRLALMVKMRTISGRGADGTSWSPPKDDPSQRPLNRTGELISSITHKKPRQAKKSKAWSSSVQSKPGKRKDASKTASKRAKAATAKAREAATQAFQASGTLARGAKLTKEGKLSLRGVKRHRVRTSGNLAAILSVPPQDKKGKKGGRKVYRIYEVSGTELQACFGIAKTKIKPAAKRRPKRGK